MGEENPHHRAIDAAAQRAHDERMKKLRPFPGLAVWEDRAPRELSDDERLGHARERFAEGVYEEAETFASSVVRSVDATSDQRAEAQRIRAVSLAEQGYLDRAIEDAEAALALAPDASGLVPAAHLRVELAIWRHRVSGVGSLLRSGSE